MENIFKSVKDFIDSREESTIEIPIKLGEFEQLAIETIKKDTGVDLTGKLKCSYDDETYSITTIIDDDKITDEELNQLNGYHPDEWYLNTESILSSFFHLDDCGASIYTNQGEIDYASKDNLREACCYIYMSYDDFEKIKNIETENKIWKIPVEWSSCGVIDVNANNLKEAINKVYYFPDNFELPVHHNYIDGSFRLCLEDDNNLLDEVNLDYIKSYNKNDGENNRDDIELNKALEILNFYRNAHYNESTGTKEGKLAQAINIILPEFIRMNKSK